MLKVGLAACSTETLEGVALCDVCCVGGCTGGGTLARPPFSSMPSSSCRLTESIIPGSEERPDLSDTGRADREACSSFCGGAGGSSTAGAAPKGPRGPRSSSKACNVVDCVPNLRDALPLLPPGVFTGAGLGASGCCAVLGRGASSEQGQSECT